MATQKIINFQNCAIDVEDLQDPKSGEVVARAFVIVDPDDNTVYRCQMTADVAKTQGGKLMGIGRVALANGAGMKEEISKHDGSKS